jgi:hypothetical protein
VYKHHTLCTSDKCEPECKCYAGLEKVNVVINTYDKNLWNEETPKENRLLYPKSKVIDDRYIKIIISNNVGLKNIILDGSILGYELKLIIDYVVKYWKKKYISKKYTAIIDLMEYDITEKILNVMIKCL